MVINKSFLGFVRIPETFFAQKIPMDILNLVSKERKKKIAKQCFLADKWRLWSAERLLVLMLEKELSIKLSKEDLFDYNEYQKPFLKEKKIALFFNFSHSGEMVFCGISKNEIGVDVEKKEEIEIKEIGCFFSHLEQEELMKKKENKDCLNYFYDLWTLKESYIKAVGRGVHLGLETFTIKKKAGKIILLENNKIQSVKWKFKQYYLDSEYTFSVCIKENVPPQSVKQYDFNTLRNENVK